MYIVCSVVCVLLLLFLFLYLSLRYDLKSLRNQLRYRKEENSTFTLYANSSNRIMKDIISEVDLIKEETQQDKNLFLKNEKEIRDMIANISHDIRTPLTSIQGYVEMLQSSDDLKERKRYYQIVTQRLKDLEAMLDEFFLYTKLMNTSNELECENIGIYPLICQSLLSYMDVLKDHKITPEITCDEEGTEAFIHEESFRRILMNIIVNTIRYGCDIFYIRVNTYEEYIEIQFENKCKNSSDIDVTHMFERFYKGSEARTQNGSGLGLAIVYELSKRMRGNIQAKIQEDHLIIILQVKSSN